MIGERYLELALRLRRIEPELIDSYSGPSELEERVAREPQPTPAQLLDQVRDLRTVVEAEEENEARRRWLAAQLEGVEAAALSLGGTQLSYPELFARCYGLEPEYVPDDVFADAHRRLVEALPGTGSVWERAEAWLATQIVPPELVRPGLEVLADWLRERTRALIGLPDGERAEYEVVTGKLWFGLAEYKGDLRTRISMNTDFPLWSYRFPEFVTHEVYPGHHTENVWKEAELISGRGYLEAAVFVFPAQKALLTEGIAELGFEIAFGADGDTVAAELLRPLGIPYDPEPAAAVRAAKEALMGISTNLRLLLDSPPVSVEDVRAYARRWMIESDAYVDQVMDSVVNSLWRPYGGCNHLGRSACRRFVAGDPDRFGRLLREQLTTSDLLA